MDRGAIFPDAVIEILQSLFYFTEGVTIQRATRINAAGGEVLFQHLVLHRFIAGEADTGNGRALFNLHHQRTAIAQDLHVLKVAAGVQAAYRVADIVVRDLFSRVNGHVQQCRSYGNALQALKANIINSVRSRGIKR